MSEQNLKYTKDHEWVNINGDIAVVGITNHAQEALGDITFVELPEVGSSFSAGDQTGSIESVKAVSEVFIPVSGEIIEVNNELEDAPELVNEDPYAKGWIYKVKMSNAAELADLLDYDAYQKVIEE